MALRRQAPPGSIFASARRQWAAGNPILPLRDRPLKRRNVNSNGR
jgi:hypothetical protein